MIPDDSRFEDIIGDSRSGEERAVSDEALVVLSNPRIRDTLLWLQEHPDATLDRLADVVTGIESDRGKTIKSPADREEIIIDLYHRVLPKLDAHGYVTFDHEAKTITAHDFPSEMTALLDWLTNRPAVGDDDAQ